MKLEKFLSEFRFAAPKAPTKKEMPDGFFAPSDPPAPPIVDGLAVNGSLAVHCMPVSCDTPTTPIHAINIKSMTRESYCPKKVADNR